MCCMKYFTKLFLYYQQGNKSLTSIPFSNAKERSIKNDFKAEASNTHTMPLKSFRYKRRLSTHIPVTNALETYHKSTFKGEVIQTHAN